MFCTLFPLVQPLLLVRVSESVGESNAAHQEKQQGELHPEREGEILNMSEGGGILSSPQYRAGRPAMDR